MKSRIQSILERMREAEGLQNLIVWVVFGCAINALFFVAGKIAAKLLGIPIIGDIVRFLGYIPAGGYLILQIGPFIVIVGTIIYYIVRGLWGLLDRKQQRD